MLALAGIAAIFSRCRDDPAGACSAEPAAVQDLASLRSQRLKLSSPTADRRLALIGCHQSMPTRRTPIDRGRRVQITPAMVALWKRGQEILATKAEQKWEEEGGRRTSFWIWLLSCT